MIDVEQPSLALKSDEHADHGFSDVELIFIRRYDSHFFVFVLLPRLILLLRLRGLLSRFALGFDLFLKLFHLILEVVELFVNHAVFRVKLLLHLLKLSTELWTLVEVLESLILFL